MDTSSAAAAAAACALLLLLGLLGLDAAPAKGLGSAAGRRHRSCPAACHCEPDGMLVRVDCSDLGLTSVPANLSVFASYLDLSMNNISKLPSSSLHNLRFLEELRLAGNGLTHIPKGTFAGLVSLKVLMLQNNLLQQVPAEALQNLRALQSFFRLQHRPGTALGHADALSRLPLLVTDADPTPAHGILLLEDLPAAPLHTNTVAAFSAKDKLISCVLNWVWRGWLA